MEADEAVSLYRLGFDKRVNWLLFHETERVTVPFFCAIGCVAENSSVREVARETWPQLS